MVETVRGYAAHEKSVESEGRTPEKPRAARCQGQLHARAHRWRH